MLCKSRLKIIATKFKSSLKTITTKFKNTTVYLKHQDTKYTKWKYYCEHSL
jgi:hypothetical protein